MMNPFTWLRRQAAEAVVLGTADGLRAVAPEGEQPPADLAELRLMLSQAVAPKQLPAAGSEEEPPATRKGKR
ncbi:MAG TPA: hypothetical protein VGE74_07685 [Gemmata sp.]